MLKDIGFKLMQTTLDCIPCLVRQTLEAARFVSGDEELHQQIMKGVLAAASELDLEQTPPAFAQQIHRRLRMATGNPDPYDKVKQTFNRLAWEILPDIRRRIVLTDNPFELALKVAVAGNVIDFGINGNITEADVKKAIGKIIDSPIEGNIMELQEALDGARRILYLADNAGEIVFDRLLIEQMPLKQTIVAVRGKPILNDATREDAEFAEIDKLVKIIDNGSDAPGTILSDCSVDFLEHFHNADLIISKGQGNFETLSSCPENIFFLMKVKCPVIASHTGFSVGTHLLLKNKEIENIRQEGKLCRNMMEPVHAAMVQ
jgi:hypothetical protein